VGNIHGNGPWVKNPWIFGTFLVVLDIGDGKIGSVEDGESVVEIPPDILIQSVTNPIGDIIDSIYPDILKNIFVPGFFESRAILAPTLEVVEEINNYVLSLMSGDGKE
jgi:ATP-dependent DNA helicase PIF1